jgi:hypothetical protein
MKRIVVVLGFCAGWAAHAVAQDDATDATLRNWYDDPFIVLSQSFAGCPTPLGPFTTHRQMETDAHYRVEQGTTCWLAHACSKPNSYLYDAPIAAAAKARFAASPLLDGTSIWLTIQRRFINAEGCASPSFDRAAFQRMLETLPDVQHVTVRITADPRGPLPYPVRPGRN